MPIQPWRDTMLLEAIAGRLKELRAEKGVSQETVYEDTGVHKLCNYYGITLKEFFD